MAALSEVGVEMERECSRVLPAGKGSVKCCGLFAARPSARGAVASAPGCQRPSWCPCQRGGHYLITSAPEKLWGFSTPFRNSGLRWSELGRAELLLAGRSNFLTSSRGAGGEAGRTAARQECRGWSKLRPPAQRLPVCPCQGAGGGGRVWGAMALSCFLHGEGAGGELRPCLRRSCTASRASRKSEVPGVP